MNSLVRMEGSGLWLWRMVARKFVEVVSLRVSCREEYSTMALCLDESYSLCLVTKVTRMLFYLRLEPSLLRNWSTVEWEELDGDAWCRRDVEEAGSVLRGEDSGACIRAGETAYWLIWAQHAAMAESWSREDGEQAYKGYSIDK